MRGEQNCVEFGGLPPLEDLARAERRERRAKRLAADRAAASVGPASMLCGCVAGLAGEFVRPFPLAVAAMVGVFLWLAPQVLPGTGW